jgi:hypothetical protein
LSRVLVEVKEGNQSWAWKRTFVIPATLRQRQEDLDTSQGKVSKTLSEKQQQKGLGCGSNGRVLIENVPAP